MEVFLKTLAAAMVALVLLPAVQKDLGLALSLILCVMASAAAFSLLEPVIDFLRELEGDSLLGQGTLKLLLKLTGLGLTGELVSGLCRDAGSGALSRCLQLLTMAVLVSLSIPVFRGFLQLVGEILAWV